MELEATDGPVVLTRAVVVSAAEQARSPAASACLTRDWDVRPAGPAIARVGVDAESVTFRAASGAAVFGCDGVSGGAAAPRWCGAAFGRLSDGRLRDPRLDLAGCSTDDGDPVAFVWIEPGPDARYVAVRRDGYVEAYEVAAGLPIRVATTSGFLEEPLGVDVTVSEHDASGRLLRRRTIEARPAG